MNNEQQSNGTSTPSAIVQQAVEQVYEFPRAQEAKERLPVKYGDRQEVLRVSDTETVTIDAYFFASPTNLRLKKIKPALSGLMKSGVKLPDGTLPEGKNGQVWFNANVRDPFHRVLRYAAKYSLEKGSPVSVAFTKRVNATTGEVVVTAKHGFEHVIKLPTPASVAGSAVKQLADQAAANAAQATQQSANRARKQGKSKKDKPLTPLVNAEAGNRIDAMIAEAEAAKAQAAANGTPAPAPEQTPAPAPAPAQ